MTLVELNNTYIGIACEQTLFYCFICSFQKLAVNKSPAVYILSRLTDLEEKIEARL